MPGDWCLERALLCRQIVATAASPTRAALKTGKVQRELGAEDVRRKHEWMVQGLSLGLELALRTITAF